MDYAIVVVPAAPVRRKPDHRQEMVNQLLFGESVQLLKSKGTGWVKIRSLHDGYEGWVTENMLECTDEAMATGACAYTTTGIPAIISLGEKKLMIPVASSLPFFEPSAGNTQAGIGKLAGLSFELNGPYRKRDDQGTTGALISELAMPWLNAPYLWGGRSSFGIDCSGFVQVIYKMAGFDLPRDAWQQSAEGRSVKKFKDAIAGDLVFFNKKRRITHVGIYLGEGRVIHCSGRVKIDIIDKKGMTDAVTGKLLSLYSIRRVL